MERHTIGGGADARRGLRSLTVAFDAPLRLKYDALKLRAPFDGNIVFIANESSKRARASAAAPWLGLPLGGRWRGTPATGAGECWVAQASPAWSAEHCELPPGEAAAKLCAAFLSLVERDGAGSRARALRSHAVGALAFPITAR